MSPALRAFLLCAALSALGCTTVEPGRLYHPDMTPLTEPIAALAATVFEDVT